MVRSNTDSSWGDEITKLLNESNSSKGFMWQAMIRERFLPPPVTRAMRQIDPVLEPYVGPEATITILMTLIVMWLLGFFISQCRGTGKAIVDEEEQVLESKLSQGASTTVLLAGSKKAGKTRLFCQIAHGIPRQETVMSLKPNISIVNDIKYVDWPGISSEFSMDIRYQRNLRVIFVVDATQPARTAADKLFLLLNEILWPQYQKYKVKTPVFVACHKKDLPKAKNEKRIKIQLRTEIERLVLARSDDDKVKWWASEDRLELDDIAICSLHFGSTTSESKGAPELSEFCKTGEFPKDSS